MRVAAGRLLVAGRDAEALAREHGTPPYVYDLRRVAEVTRALQGALGRAGLTPRVRLAMNVMNDHRIYAHDLEYVVCGRADAPPTQRVTVAGHINEGDDLFGEDVAFPEVAEGDIVAMVSSGGYSHSMWTDHCGRPRAGALFFEERA